MLRAIQLLTVFTILSAGCSKDYLLDRKEHKLIGAWEFEKAFYKRDNALFRKDITYEYRNDVIEFFSDYSAIYDDFSLRAIFAGDWRIILDKDFSGEDSSYEFFIDAVFYDFIHGVEFSFFGSIDKLNRNKLHLEATDRNGCYTFKLRRL